MLSYWPGQQHTHIFALMLVWIEIKLSFETISHVSGLRKKIYTKIVWRRNNNEIKRIKNKFMVNINLKLLHIE